MNLVGTMRQDALYALRTMRRNPAFAAIAVMTLALGIGATTAIFTVVNAVLLKPLAFHEPDRLVRVSGGATVTRFEDIRQAARSFTDVGAIFVVVDHVTLSGVDGPEPLKGARVTANFLSILGVAPLVGRSFLPAEEKPGPPVAMISAALWKRRFGGDPRIVGATARLDAGPCTIVGVLPEGFQFPFSDLDVWKPWQPEALPLQTRLHSPILN